jgi:hypothetical protein
MTPGDETQGLPKNFLVLQPGTDFSTGLVLDEDQQEYRDGTGSVPLEEDEPGTPAGPAEPEEDGTGLVPMTLPERAALTGKHWLGGVVDMWASPGRLFHDMWAKPDEPVAEYLFYIWHRKFVPPEIEGRAATIWGVLGIIAYAIFSVPFVLISKAIGVAFKRLLRAALIVLFGYLAVQALLHII